MRATARQKHSDRRWGSILQAHSRDRRCDPIHQGSELPADRVWKTLLIPLMIYSPTLAPLRRGLSYGRLSCGGLVFKACTFRLLPHRKPIFVNQLEAAFEQLEPELAVGFRPNVAGLTEASRRYSRTA